MVSKVEISSKTRVINQRLYNTIRDDFSILKSYGHTPYVERDCQTTAEYACIKCQRIVTVTSAKQCSNIDDDYEFDDEFNKDDIRVYNSASGRMHILKSRDEFIRLEKIISDPTFEAEIPKIQEKDKGEKMANEVVKKSKKPTLQMVKESAVHGAKVAAVDEVGDSFLDLGKELLGEFAPKEMFENESGRALTKAITAVLLYHFNGTMMENLDGLDTACSLQIEASSRDLGQPLLNKMKPKLDKLARLGKSLSESK
jgi:hypothetical protein